MTLVTAKTIKLLLCARTRAREKEDYRYFHSCKCQSLILYSRWSATPSEGGLKQPVTFVKMTRRFSENNPLFRDVRWGVLS